MKRHWKVALLFTFCMIYLFLGAFLFSHIEGFHEEQTRAKLNNSIAIFIDQHPGVSYTDLIELLLSIKDAADQGIAPDLMLAQHNDSIQGMWVERPVARRNWDLPNAFFFSTTVITTIGMYLFFACFKKKYSLCSEELKFESAYKI